MKRFIIAFVIVDYENKIRDRLEIRLEDNEVNIRIIKAEDWHSALCKALGQEWNWPSSSIEDAKKYGIEECCTLFKIKEIEIEIVGNPI